MSPSPEGDEAGLGLLAFSLGIASIPGLFVCFLGVPLAVAAIVTGGLALARGRPRSGKAVAGVVLGLIALAGAVVLIARPDS
jgi:hypothetical protein